MALINTAENHENSGSNFSSIALPATSLTAGNLIVVGFSTFRFFAAAPTGTIADTAGNTYVSIGRVTDPVNGFNAIHLYYCANCLGHASNVVTVTYSAGSSFNSVVSAQYSGVQTAPLDASDLSSESTSTTSHSSGAFTTALADELILAYAGTQSSVDETFTNGTGYVVQQVGSTTALEDQTVSSIQTGVTAGFSGPSCRWLMIVATFKLVAATAFSGDAAGDLTLEGSAAAILGAVADAAGVLWISGAADGPVLVFAADAAGALTIGGSAAAVLGLIADAAGDLTIEGSATGKLASVPITCITGSGTRSAPMQGDPGFAY